MTKNNITKQIRDVNRMIKNASNRYMEVVCVEDGQETNNTYPVLNVYEPDTKSPEDWVRGIHLHNRLNGIEVDVSFKMRQGKNPFEF